MWPRLLGFWLFNPLSKVQLADRGVAVDGRKGCGKKRLVYTELRKSNCADCRHDIHITTKQKVRARLEEKQYVLGRSKAY